MTNNDLDALALQNDDREGERVVQAVYDYLRRFVSHPSEHARVAHTLWVLHTHLMDRWETTPRLAFLSAEPASGKSRALDATEPLVPNAVHAVNVSPAYLFRKVGDQAGVTILFDEIDTIFGPKAKENEETRGFLNAGHSRGAVAGRCVVRGKTVETEEIPAFAPVAVAGLHSLPDTILTRSVIVRMRRRLPGEEVEPFRRRINHPEGIVIRDRIERWTSTLPDEEVWPKMPPEIQDRDADVWEPLIAVADLAGGHWPKRAREAAVALVADSKEGEPSLGIRLLADIKRVFDATVLRELTSKAILETLLRLEEAPWGDLRGRPLDGRGLARILKQYDIRPKTLRILDTTPRGYHRADFEDAWRRYVPDKTETSETPTTSSFSVLDVSHVADAGPNPDGWSFQLDDEPRQ